MMKRAFHMIGLFLTSVLLTGLLFFLDCDRHSSFCPRDSTETILTVGGIYSLIFFITLFLINIFAGKQIAAGVKRHFAIFK